MDPRRVFQLGLAAALGYPPPFPERDRSTADVLQPMKTGSGFIVSLDSSGGGTPLALSSSPPGVVDD